MHVNNNKALATTIHSVRSTVSLQLLTKRVCIFTTGGVSISLLTVRNLMINFNDAPTAPSMNSRVQITRSPFMINLHLALSLSPAFD